MIYTALYLCTIVYNVTELKKYVCFFPVLREFIILLHSSFKGSKLSVFSCTAWWVIVHRVFVHIIACICLLLSVSVCAWMFCLHMRISVHDPNSCGCMNEGLYASMCVYHFYAWISNMSSRPPLSSWFHVALRCLISSPLLTKQFHIRCLDIPSDIICPSVWIRDTGDKDVELISLSNHPLVFSSKAFMGRNWSVKSVNKSSSSKLLNKEEPEVIRAICLLDELPMKI